MVAILLGPLVIPADRLDVAVRARAEPCVGIGWRQRDRVQPIDGGAPLDPVSLRIENRPSACPSSCG
nr:F12 [uncultured bacterium]